MIRTILLLAVSLSAFGADLMVVALPKEIVQADNAFAAAENARDEAYIKWAKSAKLSLLEVPARGEDARPSEVEAWAKVKSVNQLVLNVQQSVEQLESAIEAKRNLDGKNGYKFSVREAVAKLMKAWPEYVAAKGK